MPDENKFAVLRGAGYRIPAQCGFCQFGQFQVSSNQLNPQWGTCGQHQYDHGKHTGEARGVSIHTAGCCNSYVENVAKTAASGLGAFMEFLPGRVAQDLPPSQGRKQKSK